MNVAAPHYQLETVEAKHLVGGEWIAGSNTFQSLNPADKRHIVGQVPTADAKTVDQAVQAARQAFDSWRSKSWVQRAEIVDNFAQLLKRDHEELSRLVTIECGKPINEGRADVIEALHMAQYVAGLGRLPIGQVISSEIPEKDAYIWRKPKGVTAVITPWNFPVAIPLWGVLPAVLAGNTVVLKPSEDTPICCHKLAELFVEAGFPRGVINVVQGDGANTGDALVRHNDVDLILFTGSKAVGTHIQQIAAKEVHKFVVTEMGGKNATVILADAKVDLAVNACILGAFKTSGQRCVTTGRVIIDTKVIDEFTEKFVAKAKKIRIGNGLEDTTFMGPLINGDGIEKWKTHNAKAKEEGGNILLDGQHLTEGDYAHGNFVEPFIYRFDKYVENTFCLREEAFSPHCAIIGVDGLEEAIRVHNDTEYGLAAAIITENYRNWRLFREKAEFGLGYVNLPSIGAEVHLPFGGVKGSGNGHPAAEGALEAVTHRIAFTVNHADQIMMAQGLGADIE